MKERPILFNGEMVRAILEGRKTQTRRPVKATLGDYYIPDPSLPIIRAYDKSDKQVGVLKCPHGTVGDRLWVRETFSRGWLREDNGNTLRKLSFRASDDLAPNATNWTPSIHMPRWASRLLLEITAVRVERVQEISEADARAEGVIDRGNYWLPTEEFNCPCTFAYGAFCKLWQSAYPGSWERNDWVWVVEFKRI